MSPLALLTLAAAMVAVNEAFPFPDYWQYYDAAMKTLHADFDFNQDGILTQADFDGLAKKHVELTPKADPLYAPYWKGVYTVFWTTFSTANLFGPPITPDQFVVILKRLGVNNPETSIFTTFNPMVLLVDYDKLDGGLNADEFRAFFRPHGMTDEQMTTAFNKLDTGKDGKMSWDELHTALIKWVSTTDKAVASEHFLFFVLKYYNA